MKRASNILKKATQIVLEQFPNEHNRASIIAAVYEDLTNRPVPAFGEQRQAYQSRRFDAANEERLSMKEGRKRYRDQNDQEIWQSALGYAIFGE